MTFDENPDVNKTKSKEVHFSNRGDTNCKDFKHFRIFFSPPTAYLLPETPWEVDF